MSPPAPSSGSGSERHGHQTQRGLAGFYASCTVFGVAVSLSTVIWIAFPDIQALQPIGWIGLVVAVVAALTTWHYLGLMRNER